LEIFEQFPLGVYVHFFQHKVRISRMNHKFSFRESKEAAPFCNGKLGLKVRPFFMQG